MKKLTENHVETDDDDYGEDEALSLNKSIGSSSSSSSFWHRFTSSFKKKKKKCNETTNATSLHKSRKHNNINKNDSIKRKRSQGSHLNSYIILSDTDDKEPNKTNFNSLLLASSLNNSKEENTDCVNSLRSKSAPPPAPSSSSSSFNKHNSFNCLNASGDCLSDANEFTANNNAVISSSSSTSIMNVIKIRQQKKKKSSTLSNKTITNNTKINNANESIKIGQSYFTSNVNVSNSMVHHLYSSNFAFVYCQQCHTNNTNNNNVNKKR
jgi:hypothetical protein